MFEKIRHVGLGLILLTLALATPVFSKGNDVEFHGAVTRVNLANAANASITLHVEGFDVTVRVTTDTDVDFQGDELELSDIAVGDFVKVSGFFANSGITAREIMILDRGDGEFRLRGLISAVRAVSGGTLITVLGVDLLVDADTKLERRGSNATFTAANLAIDQNVDARGFHRNGQFVAARIKVGSRDDDPIRVHFEGKISTVATGRLTIDTEGGSSAIVLIDSSTIVTGTPAVGRFVEVNGTLNSNLAVVADRVIVKLNRNDDDEPAPRPITKFDKKIRLNPVGAASSISGEAEAEFEQKGQEVEQHLEVEFKHGLANTDYVVRMDVVGSGTVLLGTIRTNREGEADIKLKDSALSAQLTAGKTVRDITRVQILTMGGIVVAEGVF